KSRCGRPYPASFHTTKTQTRLDGCVWIQIECQFWTLLITPLNDSRSTSEMMLHSTYKRVEIADRERLLSYASQLPSEDRNWVFRGMSSNFPLQTSLERVLIDAGVALTEAPDIERKLLKEVKRRAHFYVDPLPTDGDVLGWLALMQHHGA